MAAAPPGTRVWRIALERSKAPDDSIFEAVRPLRPLDSFEVPGARAFLFEVPNAE